MTAAGVTAAGALRFLLPAGACAVLLLLPRLTANEYLLALGVSFATFSVLASGLNLVYGYTGLLSFAQVGFFGIGAYAAALLVTEQQWPFLAAVAAGGAIAIVLATGPTLLLLDEPSLGLSPGNQEQVFATIAELRGRGLTVLLVEQNAHGALGISDIGIVMELGRVTAMGPAQEILNDPRIKVAYLGGG